LRILVLESPTFVSGGCSCDATEVDRTLRQDPDLIVEHTRLTELNAARHEPDLVVLVAQRTAGLARATVKLRRKWGQVPVIACFCCTSTTPPGVMRALAGGVDDYLNWPVRDIDLLPRVKRLLQRRAARRGLAGTDRRVGFSLKNLVGESESFLRAVELIPRLGDVDGTLLITGETGTGKELFARAIHYAGPRKGKPFVPVNCGALPDHLVENELFGHARGAYTDAASGQQGLVAESEGGTLFLDEVEALSPAAQAKLLRFLQDYEYRQLGSPKTHRADVRVIAATNVDLKAEVEAQRYREDLFYRLSVLLLRIPALRDRGEDIPLLARHFARRYARRQGRPQPHFSDDAVACLMAHGWPGNVRELEAVVQRSVLMARSGTLEAEDIELLAGEPGERSTLRAFQEAKSSAIDSFERSYLTRVLTVHAGNISEAARAAGTDRRALQRLMRKHGIDRRLFIA
jgi:DNA-binding NtrC family response regulator